MAKITYYGMELEEVTEPQIFDEPKKCMVWDDTYTECEERNVVAVARIMDNKMTVALDDYGSVWKHCVNIPEKSELRRVTNRELAKWLAQGNGEWCNIRTSTSICSNYSYCYNDSNNLLTDTIRVRKWDDTEWHEPTVDYMDIKD